MLDPEPKPPEDDFKIKGHAIDKGQYVHVDSDSVAKYGNAKAYLFTETILTDFIPILASDWSEFGEEMSVLDLGKLDDGFLMFREHILTSTVAKAAAPTVDVKKEPAPKKKKAK